MGSHDHCWSCVSPSCSLLTACNILSCPDCDLTLHECKLEDHNSICSEKTVPCINVDYGCPDYVIRRLMGRHLAVCSLMTPQKISCDIVSCEHCSMEMPSTDLTDHYLACDYIPVPCTNTPFGCQMILKRIEINVHLAHCPASITQCLYMYSRTNHEDSIVITKDEKSQLPDEKFFFKDQEDSSEYALSLIPMRTGLYLPSVREEYLENLTRGQRISSDGIFVCGGFIRRDEFSSHWLSHIELLDDLPLKIRRCPFASYGCQHATITAQPKGGTFEYNDEIRSLVVCPSVGVYSSSQEGSGFYASQIAKKRELAMYGYNEGSGSLDVIGQLPFEVLLRILSHVDSLSLWSLSQVNRYLRNICEELLSTRGIVYVLWEKENKHNKSGVKWKPSTKHWTFSKVFSSPHSWKATPNPFICSHMESCETYASLETSLNSIGLQNLKTFYCMNKINK